MSQKQQSITNNNFNTETWKWSSGVEVPIEQLSLLEACKASIHCMKRIRQYSDKVAFYEYKEKIAKTEVQKRNAEESISYCNKMVLFFSNKLDVLSEYTIRKFNVEIPQTFDELKQLLSELKPEPEPQKQEINEESSVESN